MAHGKALVVLAALLAGCAGIPAQGAPAMSAIYVKDNHRDRLDLYETVCPVEGAPAGWKRAVYVFETRDMKPIEGCYFLHEDHYDMVFEDGDQLAAPVDDFAPGGKTKVTGNPV